jgi:hypothetical protein
MLLCKPNNQWPPYNERNYLKMERQFIQPVINSNRIHTISNSVTVEDEQDEGNTNININY